MFEDYYHKISTIKDSKLVNLLHGVSIWTTLFKFSICKLAIHSSFHCAVWESCVKVWNKILKHVFLWILTTEWIYLSEINLSEWKLFYVHRRAILIIFLWVLRIRRNWSGIFSKDISWDDCFIGSFMGQKWGPFTVSGAFQFWPSSWWVR